VGALEWRSDGPVSTRDDDILDFDFFDEEEPPTWEEPPEHGSGPPRGRGPRGPRFRAPGNLTPLLRLMALIALAILIVVLLAVWAEGCASDRKRDRYGDYMTEIGAIGNAAGRIFSGWLSDSVGRVKTLSLMVLLSAIVLPLLGRIHSLILLWPLLFVVYYCYGTQLSLYASTTADFFGSKNVGTNYGLVFLAWGVAGVLGPKLGGRLYDQFQNYTRAFDIAAVFLLIAFAIIFTLRPPQREAQAVAAPAAAPAGR